MGRNYQTTSPQSVDFMAQLPEEAIIKGTQMRSATYQANKNLISKLSLVDAETFPGLSDKMNDLLGNIEGRVDELAGKIDADLMEYSKYSPELADLALDIERQFVKGEIGHLQGIYKKTEDFLGEELKRGAAVQDVNAYRDAIYAQASPVGTTPEGRYEYADRGAQWSPELRHIPKFADINERALKTSTNFKSTQLAGLDFVIDPKTGIGELTDPARAAGWSLRTGPGGTKYFERTWGDKKFWNQEDLQRALELGLKYDENIQARKVFVEEFMPDEWGPMPSAYDKSGNPVRWFKNLAGEETSDIGEAMTKYDAQIEAAIAEQMLNLSGGHMKYNHQISAVPGSGSSSATQKPVFTVTQHVANADTAPTPSMSVGGYANAWTPTGQNNTSPYSSTHGADVSQHYKGRADDQVESAVGLFNTGVNKPIMTDAQLTQFGILEGAPDEWATLQGMQDHVSGVLNWNGTNTTDPDFDRLISAFDAIGNGGDLSGNPQMMDNFSRMYGAVVMHKRQYLDNVLNAGISSQEQAIADASSYAKKQDYFNDNRLVTNNVNFGEVPDWMNKFVTIPGFATGLRSAMDRIEFESFGNVEFANEETTTIPYQVWTYDTAKNEYKVTDEGNETLAEIRRNNGGVLNSKVFLNLEGVQTGQTVKTFAGQFLTSGGSGASAPLYSDDGGGKPKTVNVNEVLTRARNTKMDMSYVGIGNAPDLRTGGVNFSWSVQTAGQSLTVIRNSNDMDVEVNGQPLRGIFRSNEAMNDYMDAYRLIEVAKGSLSGKNKGGGAVDGTFGVPIPHVADLVGVVSNNGNSEIYFPHPQTRAWTPLSDLLQYNLLPGITSEDDFYKELGKQSRLGMGRANYFDELVDNSTLWNTPIDPFNKFLNP